MNEYTLFYDGARERERESALSHKIIQINSNQSLLFMYAKHKNEKPSLTHGIKKLHLKETNKINT